MENWKISPSDLTFLWDECPRCFYLKVRHKFKRPGLPFPKIYQDRLADEGCIPGPLHTEDFPAAAARQDRHERALGHLRAHRRA